MGTDHPEAAGLAGRQGWALSPSGGRLLPPTPTAASPTCPGAYLGQLQDAVLRTGARMFILPAYLRGALRRRGGLDAPGDPGPWRPDNHPRPRGPDYNSGPRRAYGACGLRDATTTAGHGM